MIAEDRNKNGHRDRDNAPPDDPIAHNALAATLPAGKAERMPKMNKKGDLPTKVCAACGLPFAWRKN